MTHSTSALKTPDADFHQRMKDRRREAGYTLEGALMALHREYPGWAPNLSTLSRLETKTTEERADDLALLMLARLYKCTIGDLSPLRATANMECLSDLLSTKWPWITDCAGQLALPAFAAA